MKQYDAVCPLCGKANNDDVLPDWLEGLIKIYEEPNIMVRKSTK